jgi:hypothetical protein
MKETFLNHSCQKKNQINYSVTPIHLLLLIINCMLYTISHDITY